MIWFSVCLSEFLLIDSRNYPFFQIYYTISSSAKPITIFSICELIIKISPAIFRQVATVLRELTNVFLSCIIINYHCNIYISSQMEEKMAYTIDRGTPNAYRRQKQIEDCLFANLQQRPYASVSVSDLCLQLEISRKSFYNYFPDKDSCLRSLITRTLRQCILQITSFPQGSSPDLYITALLTFWKDQRPLLDVLVRNKLLFVLLEQSIAFLIQEDRHVLECLSTPLVDADDFVLANFVSVHYTMILQWYRTGFSIPVEDMILVYKRLVYQPLIQVN